MRSSQTGLLNSPSKSSGGCVHVYITHFISRALFVRLPVIRKAILILLLLTVVSLMVLCYHVSNGNLSIIGREGGPNHPHSSCLTLEVKINEHWTNAQTKLERKVLVIVESNLQKQAREILTLLEGSRIKYKMVEVSKPLPPLTSQEKGRFASVVFERLESYLNFEKTKREALDNYCREYNAGIIAFAKPDAAYISAQVKGFPLFIHSKLTLQDYEINAQSPVLRITKAAERLTRGLPRDDWTVFVPNHTTYEPLAYGTMHLSHEVEAIKTQVEAIRYIPAIVDKGSYDGIRRIIFGFGFRFWLHRPLFLDSLSYLSHGKLSVSLKRYLLVDIDDIFVGKKGIRMTAPDVQALLDAQARLSHAVPGFVFNLGFSGYYYKAGTTEENEGDAMLLAKRNSFWWFPHMWRHYQPHTMNNLTSLIVDMEKNKQFAMLHNIPVNKSYAIAPHHSGVFPVHEELYSAWSSVWGIEVTSTEEYPRLKPAQRHRGFVHRNIQVLPRQTCGLFTHTIFMDKYPNGPGALDASIQGGELFQTFLCNPVNIFMTHLSNYGNDRLGIYTFENVIKFIQCWTNLQIVTVPPKELAKIYFDEYPDERTPLWRNPCHDKRHMMIWSEKKNCKRLPSFLVIGPQKTGTTALHSFLNMHPDVTPSLSSDTTFEEVQFFNGKNYFKGLDWYMEFFPVLPNASRQLLYDKSANYFDSEDAPARAHALLPRAKIISILIDPAKRAYSWYQHMRAHNDPIATSHTFYEVLRADDASPRGLQELRKRCLMPGLYAQHLEKWLVYFSPPQLMIVDGERLKTDPAAVMDRVQSFLSLSHYYNYSQHLRFSSKKGFFCPVVGSDTTKCLGAGKGRNYPPMTVLESAYLHDIYRKENTALWKLLVRLGRRIPSWLDADRRDER